MRWRSGLFAQQVIQRRDVACFGLPQAQMRTASRHASEQVVVRASGRSRSIRTPQARQYGMGWRFSS
jgi:hypothetical protein